MSKKSLTTLGIIIPLLLALFAAKTSVAQSSQKAYTPSVSSLQVDPVIPEMIKVGNCSLDGQGKILQNTCSSIEVVDFDYYLKRVVSIEMSAIWGDFDKFTTGNGNEGMNALMAQAVAARSYAINFINNNNTSLHGKIICASFACQEYGIIGSNFHPYDGLLFSNSIYNNAEVAVLNTQRYVLVDLSDPSYGGIAPAYYAASTNGLGTSESGSALCTQGDGWTGDPDFAEGYFGVAGFPCHQDDVLSTAGVPVDFGILGGPSDGHPRSGHGAGMSQTGALRWAIGTHWNPRWLNGVSGAEYPYYNNSLATTPYANPASIGSNIVNSSSVKIPVKDWRQNLMHYYVYPFVSFKSNPGDPANTRTYAIAIAKKETDDSTTIATINPETWKGTEITINGGMKAQVPIQGTTKLILDIDDSGRPSYLMCGPGASVDILAGIELKGGSMEIGCDPPAPPPGGAPATITLNQGALVTADGACLLAGDHGTLVFGANSTTTI